MCLPQENRRAVPLSTERPTQETSTRSPGDTVQRSSGVGGKDKANGWTNHPAELGYNPRRAVLIQRHQLNAGGDGDERPRKNVAGHEDLGWWRASFEIPNPYVAIESEEDAVSGPKVVVGVGEGEAGREAEDGDEDQEAG